MARSLARLRSGNNPVLWIEAIFVKTYNYEVERIAFWYVPIFPTYQFPDRSVPVCLLTLTEFQRLLKDLLSDLFCHKEFFPAFNLKGHRLLNILFTCFVFRNYQWLKIEFLISEISNKITLKVKKKTCICLKISLELISNKCQGIVLALCKHHASKRQHHLHPAYEYGK